MGVISENIEIMMRNTCHIAMPVKSFDTGQ